MNPWLFWRQTRTVKASLRRKPGGLRDRVILSPVSTPRSLSELRTQFVQISDRVRGRFGATDDALLTKRPNAESWSPTECLAHLNLSVDPTSLSGRKPCPHDQIVNGLAYRRDFPPAGIIAKTGRRQRRAIALDPIGRCLEVDLDSGQRLLNRAISLAYRSYARSRQAAAVRFRTTLDQHERVLALGWRQSGEDRRLRRPNQRVHAARGSKPRKRSGRNETRSGAAVLTSIGRFESCRKLSS